MTLPKLKIPNLKKISALIKGFEPQNELAAFLFIVAGLYYFLKYHKIKTFAVLAATATVLTVSYNILAPESVQISRYTIPSETSSFNEAPSGFSLFPIANAQFKREGEKVWIDGVYLGRMDSTWFIFRLPGEQAIVVYDRISKVAERWDLNAFNRERMRGYKK